MIHLTDSAKAKLLSLATEEGITPTVRVGLKGSGCAGFSFDLGFEEIVRDSDTIFEYGEVKVVVDEMSMQYIDDTTIDYIDGLMSSGFKFASPKAKHTCGCGSSVDF